MILRKGGVPAAAKHLKVHAVLQNKYPARLYSVSKIKAPSAQALFLVFAGDIALLNFKQEASFTAMVPQKGKRPGADPFASAFRHHRKIVQKGMRIVFQQNCNAAQYICIVKNTEQLCLTAAPRMQKLQNGLALCPREGRAV